MKVTKTVCDICRKTVGESGGTEWSSLSDVAHSFYMSIMRNTCHVNSDFDVCPVCALKLAKYIDSNSWNADPIIKDLNDVMGVK